jgi:hypothetical protein
MDLYENRSENSLKGDPSNDTTVNPPLFSLVNTFNVGHQLDCYVHILKKVASSYTVARKEIMVYRVPEILYSRMIWDPPPSPPETETLVLYIYSF